MIAHVDDSTSHDGSDSHSESHSAETPQPPATPVPVDYMHSTGVLMQRNGKLPFQSPATLDRGAMMHEQARVYHIIY
jgi:hypothetical protein